MKTQKSRQPTPRQRLIDAAANSLAKGGLIITSAAALGVADDIVGASGDDAIKSYYMGTSKRALTQLCNAIYDKAWKIKLERVPKLPVRDMELTEFEALVREDKRRILNGGLAPPATLEGNCVICSGYGENSADGYCPDCKPAGARLEQDKAEIKAYRVRQRAAWDRREKRFANTINARVRYRIAAIVVTKAQWFSGESVPLDADYHLCTNHGFLGLYLSGRRIANVAQVNHPAKCWQLLPAWEL